MICEVRTAVLCKRQGSSLPFEQETSTGDDHILEVVANGAERVMLYHATNGSQFIPRLSPVYPGDKANALVQGQVCPVDTVFGVDVFWMEDAFEYSRLFVRHALVRHVCSDRELVFHVGS